MNCWRCGERRFDFELLEVAFTRNYLVKDGQQIEKDPKSGPGHKVSVPGG